MDASRLEWTEKMVAVARRLDDRNDVDRMAASYVPNR